MTNRYQVLARRYRPSSFQEVVGQEVAVTTLKNALERKRIAHAYLFAGPRGVGKTTLARLFAKALNCERLSPDKEPCEKCSSCSEISSGQSLDVIEIDGASNRGIDDIRQINETVSYAPSHGNYKIYIIDEVHMLTKEAFNALLKTLEEPPEKTKFFFATTEPHKLPPTIISRCQRFDLHRIPQNHIVQKLKQIAQDLEKPIESEAIELIACFSEGSLRDAESLLDQILCFSDKKVELTTVKEALGLAPQELFDLLDDAFSQSDPLAAFTIAQKLIQMGKDLSHFYQQLVQHFRNIVQRAVSGEEKIYSLNQALFILDLILEKEALFQKSLFPRISLESVLLQIIRSKNRIPVETLVRLLLENKEKIAFVAPKGETPPVQIPSSNENPCAPPPKDEDPTPKPSPENAPSSENEPVALHKKEETPPVQIPFSNENTCSPPPKDKDPIPKPSSKNAPSLENEPIALYEEEEKKPFTKVLKPVPFSPFSKKSSLTPSSLPEKHPSHYDTLMRFAAVELEGIIKN